MIENAVAYEAGKIRRIKANACIARRRAWEASVADHSRIKQFLRGCGEFGLQCAHCKVEWTGHLGRESESAPTDKCRCVSHPVIASAYYGTGGEIALKMRDALDNWGSLTPKQTDLVRSMISRAEARVATREADRAAKLAIDQVTSQHLGSVGERMTFDLTVERVMTFETQFGLTHIHLCRSEGAVVVYKGSSRLVTADATFPVQVTVKATVKAHELREGVAQTIISRPNVQFTEVAA